MFNFNVYLKSSVVGVEPTTIFLGTFSKDQLTEWDSEEGILDSPDYIIEED